MPANKTTLYLFIILFFSFAFFVVFDLALGYFLIRQEGIRIPHHYYHHCLRPMTESEAVWGNNTYIIRTNSLGFKDADMRCVELKTDMRRTLFMGDSFTEGIGYDFEETFVGLLSQRTKDHIEILNAGVVSYSPKTYYLKTEYLIKKGLEFDEIVIMLDISDIQDEIIYEYFTPSEKPDYLKKIDIRLSNYSYSYRHLFRNILKRLLSSDNETDISEIFQGTLPDRGSWSYDDEVFHDWGKRGLALAGLNMENLIALCKEKGIKPVIAVYPWPAQIMNDSSESRQVVFWEQFCKAEGIDFINLFPYFFVEDSHKTVVKYFIEGDDHWNAKGHKYIAELLFEKWFEK